jgi:hypothetical protein
LEELIGDHDWACELSYEGLWSWDNEYYTIEEFDIWLEDKLRVLLRIAIKWVAWLHHI